VADLNIRKREKSRKWGLGLCLLPRKLLKTLCQNNAFLCKCFTCFKMHPVNASLNSPLSLTGVHGAGFHASKRLENLCPESCLLIVIGIILGVITYFSSDQNEIIEFDAHLFFTVILPPIIMEAGYFIPTRAFFDQLGTILLHAVVATLVGLQYIHPSLYIDTELGLLYLRRRRGRLR